MTFEIFDYVDARNENAFRAWWIKLQKKEQAKLKSRIDSLRLLGEDLRPQILTDTHVPGIQKLRAPGNVQLRPLLCKGPIRNDCEYTMLMGATERDMKFDPPSAPETANDRRCAILTDHRRRTKHVSPPGKRSD